MAQKYLDYNGTSYFWSKLKAYFQEKLVSGINIKTINKKSLLGSGDISIQGGDGGSCDCVQHLLTHDNRSIVKLECLIESNQDFNGYGKPWAGGAGKNKMPTMTAEKTDLGITVTPQADGSLIINGTATGTFTYTKQVTLVSGESYIVSGCPSGGSSSTYRLDIYGTGLPAVPDYGSGSAIFVAPNNFVTLRVVIYSGVTFDNSHWYPMIRLSSESDAAFEPYENICPIEGINAFNVYNAPSTEEDDAYTYPVALNQTIYGGTVDVISGQVTKTDALISSYAGESLPSTWLSDRDVYSSGATPTIGAQVVYKLATPQTVQITPVDIAENEGLNNLWADLPIIDLKQSAQSLSAFTNDSGYLTLDTLPVYNGGVS